MRSIIAIFDLNQSKIQKAVLNGITDEVRKQFLTNNNIITMKERDIYLVTAEAEVKHMMAKLDETEAEALEKIAKAENKINRLKKVIEAVKSKRKALQSKFQDFTDASGEEWEGARERFIAAIESLEDKGVFEKKTEEWFRSIRNSASNLKSKVKETVAHW